jgi:xylose isomerase
MEHTTGTIEKPIQSRTMSSEIRVITGRREFFPGVGQICFEGKESSNPLAYKWYDSKKIIRGKSMQDHFRFAIAYWHSLGGIGWDPFGLPTRPWPWLTAGDVRERARVKMDAAFELVTKLGLRYYCFHDFDLIDEGSSLQDSAERLDFITDYALEKQRASGVKPLWGTANLFSHPRYMDGAATNPDFQVVAYAGAQVKQALDVTIKLGGENYVFWGGREGYLSLLNTDMKRELDHLATFLHMARDYARSQGFTGHLLIEPKPAEPTKHQYDFDATTVLGFLREYELLGDFKLNIEVNHATLAQHTFQHELQVAANAGVMASVDANRGDYQNGWDTDQFPNNLNELVEAMLVILEAGGLDGGGINFDAKLRRNSTDPEDLFHAHIGGIDAFARALTVADAILEHSDYREWRQERYRSFAEGAGKDFVNGRLKLEDLHEFAREVGEPVPESGRQERFENIINAFI